MNKIYGHIHLHLYEHILTFATQLWCRSTKRQSDFVQDFPLAITFNRENAQEDACPKTLLLMLPFVRKDPGYEVGLQWAIEISSLELHGVEVLHDHVERQNNGILFLPWDLYFFSF